MRVQVLSTDGCHVAYRSDSDVVESSPAFRRGRIQQKYGRRVSPGQYTANQDRRRNAEMTTGSGRRDRRWERVWTELPQAAATFPDAWDRWSYVPGSPVEKIGCDTGDEYDKVLEVWCLPRLGSSFPVLVTASRYRYVLHWSTLDWCREGSTGASERTTFASGIRSSLRGPLRR